MGQSPGSLAALAVTVTGVTAFLIFSWKELREARALTAIARSLWGRSRVADHEGLVALQTFLREHITVGGASRRRPPLRKSAHEILQSGQGFCGENARVAILLLRRGGSPANRLYLHGERGSHVLVEHRWAGHWVFFDAHSDPRTMLSPERLGAVPSENIKDLPNGHAGNPWTDFSRIRHFRSLPWGARLSKLRLPGPLTLLAESPSLVLALASLMGTAAGLAWLLR